jgi:hypothetical protein
VSFLMYPGLEGESVPPRMVSGRPATISPGSLDEYCGGGSVIRLAHARLGLDILVDCPKH